MKTLITGATGLIGRRLVAALEQPVVLSRDPARAEAALGVRAFAWSPPAPPPPEAFEGIEVVLHLAGEPVGAGRWTAKRRRRIRDSRVLGTRALVHALAQLAHRPRALISASAIGIYGDRGDEVLTEASAPGEGFLAEVCRAWEAEAVAAEAHGVRVVTMRTGIVLAPEGGALASMLPVFRLGLGGRIGSGRQRMSWIAVEDVVGLYLQAAREEQLAGALNVVAPNPVTNAEFTRTLASVLGRPALLPVPRFALRLALGQMSELLTASQRVLPERALATGYVFRHPELRPALEACLQPETAGE
ncbi:MAG: TIGR01777 family protein [Planctomycetota bacterium]|nr:MAG: TIGR01777 family protein [Planctomycetota bacterium]